MWHQNVHASEDAEGRRTNKSDLLDKQRSVMLAQGSVSTIDCSSCPSERSPVFRRLRRQKANMLRAKNESLVADIEIHIEGHTQEARYSDEIYRRGLSPGDLDRALRSSEQDGFKVKGGREGGRGGAVLAHARKPGFPHEEIESREIN